MKKTEKYNVIHVYADDLGRGLLSCYGQKKYKTPNIDSLAQHGVLFENFYGGPICAPARASLICGINECHQGKWTFNKGGLYFDYLNGKHSLEEIYELVDNSRLNRTVTQFLPTVFKHAGYVTCEIGKLEWGFATSNSEMAEHGWDYHYGYYDHGMCHGYYPPYLFENGHIVFIEGNEFSDCGSGKAYSDPSFHEDLFCRKGKAQFSQDLFDRKIVEFIEANYDHPFYLYHPSQIPHGRLAIDELNTQVKNASDLTLMEKEFASMVLRLDETVGLILRTLDRLGIMEKTILIFSSDNGHSHYYGYERAGNECGYTADGSKIDHLNVRYTSESVQDVFDGNDSMTGCKSSNFEGGVRVPLIIRHPDITQGFVSKALGSGYDFLTGFADLFGVDLEEEKDGLPIFRVFSDPEYKGHDYIVYSSANGPAIVTADGLKLRTYLKQNFRYEQFGASWNALKDMVVLELYDLNIDRKEEKNIIAENTGKALELFKLLLKECDGNLINGTIHAHFSFYGDSLPV